jgi:membrane-associated phospholipid phosphatase
MVGAGYDPFMASPTAVHATGRIPAAMVVALGYLAVVAALVLCGHLLTQVLVEGPLGHWDETSTRWLALHRTNGLDGLTAVVSRSADTLGVIASAAVVLVVLWLRRRWHQMALLVTALVLELSAFLAVNALVARDRPAVPRLGSTPSTNSFPSGHTAATLVLYAVIALCTSATARSALWRGLGWLAAVLMPLAVGFSRVYRGFHHPTDVLFGLALGLGALLVAAMAVRAWAPAQREVYR